MARVWFFYRWSKDSDWFSRVRPNNALLDIGLTQIDLDGNLVIGTGEGLLIPHELQRPGGKMLQVSDFLRGYDFPVGQTLGSFEMSQLLLSSKE